MDRYLATLAALVLLLVGASCAPAGLSVQDSCADVQDSSLALNHIARSVSVTARNGSKVVINVNTSLHWMGAKDMCEPEALKNKSAPCLQRILSVLSSYMSAMERLQGFESCARFVAKVKPAMVKLSNSMRTCLNYQTDVTADYTGQIARWEESPLCHYTLDRLYSFSILTARVFAVGDPAHHTKGSAQKCM